MPTLTEQAAERPMNIFDPLTLADDLRDAHRMCARFFATLDTTRWDRSARRDCEEWTVHETIAHLCALNGAGLESSDLTDGLGEGQVGVLIEEAALIGGQVVEAFDR